MSQLLPRLCTALLAVAVLSMGAEPSPEKDADREGRRYFKASYTGFSGTALYRMGEHSLWTRASGDTSLHLRWTWLRTGDEPISIRVTKAPGKPAVIIAKMLDGVGGYELGQSRLDRTIELKDSEWANLQTMVALPDLWTPLTDMEYALSGVLDGAFWDFELSTPERYEIVSLMSPKAEPIPGVRSFKSYITLARLLLRYSKLEIKDEDFY